MSPEKVTLGVLSLTGWMSSFGPVRLSNRCRIVLCTFPLKAVGYMYHGETILSQATTPLSTAPAGGNSTCFGAARTEGGETELCAIDLGGPCLRAAHRTG